MAVATLNRPEVRNALSPGLSAAIRDTVEALQADDRVDVVILTGADPAFCAGVDLKALSAGDVAADVGVGRGPFLNRTKLLIGAVNGPAVAGGLELALNCDVLEVPDRDQHMVILTAEPGTPSDQAMRLLRVVGTQSMVS